MLAMTRVAFASWGELRAAVEAGKGRLWYHAPLDVHPTMVRARNFKNGKIRVSTDDAAFTAEECAEQLRRFSWQAEC